VQAQAQVRQPASHTAWVVPLMCGSALAFALRRPKVQLAVDGKRFPEPILNDSIPDPVFDGNRRTRGVFRTGYPLSLKRSTGALR